MEHNSHSSYADSGDSSPLSREIDCENPSWDEPPSNYKVKFMCSYGGKIQPRPHDNQLTYVGGDTKILAVERNIRFPGIAAKISSLVDADVCFKYQLPGEDLDALISVTNDEDLEHMMIEYDRLHRASAKPARLRLFLFPQKPLPLNNYDVNDPKNDQQWFVDAINSPPSAAAPNNQDFLFGWDKGRIPPSVAKLQDPESAVPESFPADIQARSDFGGEDRNIVGEQILSPPEIQRQIHELQKLQISNQEQALFHRKSDETLGRAFPGDFYVQKIPEKATPATAPVPGPETMSVPAAYWQERQITGGGYTITTVNGAEQPVYLIPAQSGVYQTPTTVRHVTGQVGQGYYAMQRVMNDVYPDPMVYNVGPPQAKIGGGYGEGVALVRPQTAGGGVTMGETVYPQVAYDSAGRQLYYAAAPGGAVPTSYQTVTAGVEVRPSVPLNVNQEGKIAKPSQTNV